MSKRKHHTLISVPLAQRTFDKAKALESDSSPEARKAYKNLKASHHKKFTKVPSQRKMGDFWNPKGKRLAKGSGVKATKINRALKAKTN